MINLTDFRFNLLPLFRIMIQTGKELEVSYKGKVYIITVTETDMVVPYRPRRKKKRKPTQILSIETEVCDKCGAMMFQKICMNPKCHYSQGIHEENQSQT